MDSCDNEDENDIITYMGEKTHGFNREECQ